MPDPQAGLNWLAAELAGCLASAIEAMTGARPEVIAEESGTAPGADCVWREYVFRMAAEGSLWLGGGADAWNRIGRAVLAATGIEDSGAEALENSSQEIAGQAASLVSQALSRKLHADIACGPERAGAPPEEAGRLGFGIPLAGDGKITLFAAFSATVIEAVEQQASSAAAEVPETAPVPREAARPTFLAPVPGANNFDMLLDVQLPVSVSFGRSQLALKDVIKLTTGSIVELNRTISEPVDVIVNNCVIARGEVVVVEGNFGVRIHNVVSRQERLLSIQ